MVKHVSDVRAILGPEPFTGRSTEAEGTTIFSYHFLEGKNLPDSLSYSTSDIYPLSEEERSQFRQALDKIEAAANVVFVEAHKPATFDIVSVSGSDWGGWFQRSYSVGGEVAIDDQHMHVYLHEMMHALGFDHPHEGKFQLKTKFDHAENTVLTYTGRGDGELGKLDVEALEIRYGEAVNKSKWNLGFEKSTLVIDADGKDNVIDLPNAKSIVRARNGDDEVNGSSSKDKIFGNKGDDTLSGSAGDDILIGGQGADRLLDEGGADILKGGGGNDELDGGFGDDKIIGGKGDDVLVGGYGNDTFVFKGRFGSDVVIDFDPGDTAIFAKKFASRFETVEDFLDSKASVSENGVIVDLGNKGSVLMSDVTDASSLYENIDFI
ncbi:MAG: hypothetical protein ACU0FH_16585 [Heliomarina sp.]|uniref:hypothetical protein n=1 Tax=Heliomarina sp. TaxID=2917556 RepID=UPI004059231A|nr:hypothetical protein [Paracoccaceae bacterium]